jgi:hypothetical protein
VATVVSRAVFTAVGLWGVIHVHNLVAMPKWAHVLKDLRPMAGVALHDAALGGVAGLALAVSVQRYLLPTDHVLNSDGITVHEPLRVRRVAWTDVQGVIWKHEQGFLRVSRDVSGRAVARTDGMRGFTILLGSDPVAAESRRQAVDAFLRRHG